MVKDIAGKSTKVYGSRIGDLHINVLEYRKVASEFIHFERRVWYSVGHLKAVEGGCDNVHPARVEE